MADAAHLIRSMIAAAHADGLIDAEERAGILERALDAGLDASTQQFLMSELRAPATLEQIVAATRPALRLETYAAADGSQQAESAEDVTRRAQILREIESEIMELPARQREAFLMRYWEDMDVAETAAAMGCSEGSVKTHCSRAVQALSKALKAKGIQL